MDGSLGKGKKGGKVWFSSQLISLLPHMHKLWSDKKKSSKIIQNSLKHILYIVVNDICTNYDLLQIILKYDGGGGIVQGLLNSLQRCYRYRYRACFEAFTFKKEQYGFSFEGSLPPSDKNQTLALFYPALTFIFNISVKIKNYHKLLYPTGNRQVLCETVLYYTVFIPECVDIRTLMQRWIQKHMVSHLTKI